MQTLKSFRCGKYAVSGTIHEWLLASSCFSCLLLAGRMMATGTIEYIFLPWNLFLAFVPYWITWWMLRNISLVENKVKRYVALATWLLFIPNSFYIITDMFHLTHVRTAPQWFDLLLIFSFSWNGILGGIISLRRVEIVTELLGGKPFSVLLVGTVMWLSAFGIYIGRYLRYNSWDVVTNPFSLAGEIVDMIFNPFERGSAWGMTLAYGLFMTFLYFTIKKAGEAIYFNYHD